LDQVAEDVDEGRPNVEVALFMRVVVMGVRVVVGGRDRDGECPDVGGLLNLLF
jgi:hypothetical protein